MKIIKKTFGDLANNIFIAYMNDGGSAYIIDAGYAPNEIYNELKKHHLKAKGIILTHFHADHTASCNELRKLTNAPVMLHEKDAQYIKKLSIDKLLHDGDILELDGIKLEIIHTPGHSKGSICVIDKTFHNAFTGDTIFSTDTGYVTFEGGSGMEMMESIKKIDPILSDNFTIWPGHDDCVLMSYVRQHNREYSLYLNGIIPL